MAVLGFLSLGAGVVGLIYYVQKLKAKEQVEAAGAADAIEMGAKPGAEPAIEVDRNGKAML